MRLIFLFIFLFSTKVLANPLLTLEQEVAEREMLQHKIFGITPGTEEKFFWLNSEKPKKTKIALLYLHGFQATRKEVEPLPQLLAKNLGANLFMNRMTSHGQKKDLFISTTYQDWIRDVQNDLEIASQIGEEVVILATSTGATLATWLSYYFPKKIKSVILLSPFFGTKSRLSDLAALPVLGNILTKISRGSFYSWKPSNPEHAKYWKHYSHSRIIPELMKLVKMTRELPLKRITIPSCWFYTENDQVVSIERLKTAHQLWGGRKTIIDFHQAKRHVIAGDILAPPKQTQDLLELIIKNCFF